MEKNKKDTVLSNLDFLLILLNVGLIFLLLVLGVDIETVGGVSVLLFAAGIYIYSVIDKNLE